MTPQNFPDSNSLVFRRGFDPLPVYQDGSAVVSRWRPSEEELKRLNAGEDVVLYIFTSGYPVPSTAVEVSQDNPIEDDPSSR